MVGVITLSGWKLESMSGDAGQFQRQENGGNVFDYKILIAKCNDVEQSLTS